MRQSNRIKEHSIKNIGVSNQVPPPVKKTKYKFLYVGMDG